MAIDFREKLGPLPVWAWGVIGGGVIIVGYYLVNRGGTSSPDSGNVAFIDSAGYQTAGIKGGTATLPEDNSFDNNVLWLTRASAQTATRLTKPPTEVYAALKKWLQGAALSTTEQGYVDTAIGIVGTPPEGTQGISPVTPDVTPTTPTAPAAKSTYPAPPDYIGTASAQAVKYLVSNGRVVKSYSKAEWGALRIRYGNNITIKIIPQATLDRMGAKGK